MHTIFQEKKCYQILDSEQSVLKIKINCKYLANPEKDFEPFQDPEKLIAVNISKPEQSLTVTIDAKKIGNASIAHDNFRDLCSRLKPHEHGVTSKEKAEINQVFNSFMRENNLDCAKTSHVYSGSEGGAGYCR